MDAKKSWAWLALSLVLSAAGWILAEKIVSLSEFDLQSGASLVLVLGGVVRAWLTARPGDSPAK